MCIRDRSKDAAQDMECMAPALCGLRTLVKTYHALFAAAKAERNVLDFHDLEHKALLALSDDAVAQSLRAHYDAIFVDEYQDSSAIQEALLARIARADNLFFVGDVKQSIYRFRQADPGLFLQKYARFSDAEGAIERRIDLNRNFRSRKNVLEAVSYTHLDVYKRQELGDADGVGLLRERKAGGHHHRKGSQDAKQLFHVGFLHSLLVFLVSSGFR